MLQLYCTNNVYIVLCNRNGSVIVDFSLLVDAVIADKDMLRQILANQTDIKIGGYKVDLDSIRLSGKFDNIRPG